MGKHKSTVKDSPVKATAPLTSAIARAIARKKAESEIVKEVKMSFSTKPADSKRKELSDKIMALMYYIGGNFNEELIVNNDEAALSRYKSMTNDERQQELNKLKADFYLLSESKFISSGIKPVFKL